MINLSNPFPVDVLKHTYNFLVYDANDPKEICNLSLIDKSSYKAVAQLFQECWKDLKHWTWNPGPNNSRLASIMSRLMDHVEPEYKSKEEKSIFHNNPGYLLIVLRRLFHENCETVPGTFLLTPDNIQESLKGIQVNSDAALIAIWPKIEEKLLPEAQGKLSGNPGDADLIRGHINSLSPEQLEPIQETHCGGTSSRLEGQALGLKWVPIEIAKFPFYNPRFQR